VNLVVQPSGEAPRPGEATTLAKASVSSLAATVVDGIVYQAVLFGLPGRYGIAAFGGALLGAVTNFTLNRVWAFPPTAKSLRMQAAQYAVASGATYLGLQLCLMLLIEVMHINERVAWLPAKVVAWLLVSYPMHRFVVFGKRGDRKP
jgi:putative flippase GtrA